MEIKDGVLRNFLDDDTMNKQEKFEELKKIVKQGFENADCRKPYTNEPYPYFDSQITCIANKLIETCHWCEDIIRKNAVKEFADFLISQMGDREYMGVKYKQGVFSDNDVYKMINEFLGEEK